MMERTVEPSGTPGTATYIFLGLSFLINKMGTVMFASLSAW
jgi:hypothetical protein